MTAAEMRERLEELASFMSKRQWQFAINLADIKYLSQADAYIAAGFAATKNAATSAGKLALREDITEYVSLCKKLASRAAVEALEYDEAQWLWDTQLALNMALGREQMVRTHVVEIPDPKNPDKRILQQVEEKYRKVNLTAGKGLLELMGKRLQLFTEKKLIGEDPDNPFNSLKELADIVRKNAEAAQELGVVRDDEPV